MAYISKSWILKKRRKDWINRNSIWKRNRTHQCNKLDIYGAFAAEIVIQQAGSKSTLKSGKEFGERVSTIAIPYVIINYRTLYWAFSITSLASSITAQGTYLNKLEHCENVTVKVPSNLNSYNYSLSLYYWTLSYVLTILYADFENNLNVWHGVSAAFWTVRFIIIILKTAFKGNKKLSLLIFLLHFQVYVPH